MARQTSEQSHRYRQVKQTNGHKLIRQAVTAKKDRQSKTSRGRQAGRQAGGEVADRQTDTQTD